MTITLPNSGRIQTTRRLYKSTTEVEPNLGGADQMIVRPGTRYGFDVALPPRLYEVVGEAGALLWISRLEQAMLDEAVLEIPQPGLAITSVTTPRVNGASQQGSSLIVDGFPSGWTYREGQFISIMHNSRYYAHTFSADGTLAGGSGTLPIFPMLRIEPNDNDVLHVKPAYIQGRIVADQGEFTIDRMRRVGIQFSIKEKR